jgi:hypothetical protein
MSHYIGKGIAVSDAVFPDLNYIKCTTCFMMYDFPIDPFKGILTGGMEISILFDDGPVFLKPGESFKDMDRLRNFVQMDLFCRCGRVLRSWGPVEVDFDSEEPNEDYAPWKDQVKGGMIPAILNTIFVFFKILGRILLALL